MRYFSPESYQGSDQNWCGAQDKRGLLYFGNTDQGLLEYDGARWRKIPVDDNILIRDIAIGSTGIIYLGIVGDYGYVAPTPQGVLRFTSLVPKMDTAITDFQDVFKVHILDDKIYFCTKEHFFIYDELRDTVTVRRIPLTRSFLPFNLGNELIIGNDDDSLLFITPTREMRVPVLQSPGFIQETRVIRQLYGAISLSPDTILLAYSSSGLIMYDRKKHRTVDLPKNYAPRLQELINQGATIYSLHRLKNGNIAAGLIYSDDTGYIEFTPEGKEVNILGLSNGLHDSFVIEFTESNDGCLWLTHNVGISQIETSSPLRHFSEQHGINDVILDVCIHQGDVYIGTMKGIQKLVVKSTGAHFESIQGISVPIWSMTPYRDPFTNEEVLIAQGMTEPYEIRDGVGRPFTVYYRNQETGKIELSDRLIIYSGFYIHASPNEKDIVYIGTPNGIRQLRRIKNNTWLDDPMKCEPPITVEIRGIVELPDSSIWLSTYSSGIIQLKAPKNGVRETRHFTEADGLPRLGTNQVRLVGDRLYITTATGILSYDSNLDSLVPAKCPVQPGLGVAQLCAIDSTWIMHRFRSEQQVYYIELYPNAYDPECVPIRAPFKRMPSRWIDAITADPNGTIWLAIASDLYNYDPKVKTPRTNDLRAFIRSVREIRDDSLLFGGTFYQTLPDGRKEILTNQPDEMILHLPYKSNSLFFEFGSNAFAGEQQQFSFFLTHNDREWSKWDNRAEATYTNLSEGSYTLKLRVKNAYGIISSEATYQFVIDPPFYRTIWAYIIYIALAALVIRGIVMLNTRRIIAEKKRLEQIVKERTREVVAQKEQIEEQNREIVSSITYASRIQQAILPQEEMIKKIFPNHFLLYLPRDMVSGDFYWMMEIGTKKICCIADCTGHGVPGGFMSMLGTTFLHQVVRASEKLDTADILNQLRELVITSLHQSESISSNKDGMDLALYIIDTETNKLQFSGANNPLLIVRNGELLVFKADKMPIGIYIRAGVPFKSESVQLQEGDMLYTFSDGYPDQFGGPKNRKFMIKNFRELLVKIHHHPLEVQKQLLLERLIEWQRDYSRTDDVIVFGVKI